MIANSALTPCEYLVPDLFGLWETSRSETLERLAIPCPWIIIAQALRLLRSMKRQGYCDMLTRLITQRASVLHPQASVHSARFLDLSDNFSLI
ncbi:hypothetical protein DPMN_076616 [Dreissena polymorpha]|uniref:Uncharacterized protein n=1 Tax=Dreissena polymorpha TaxID=45954 RepID=A0A9D4BNU1_DREPO|nr:hypothetical protein DPMN_076616 [Dreissena polymorpha]